MTYGLLRGTLLVMFCGTLSGCGNNPTSPSPVGPSITTPPQITTPLPPAIPLVSVLADATLSGMVYEVVAASPGQIVGIDGVAVYCEQCGESTHSWAVSDSTGHYKFPRGVWTEGRPTFPIRIWIGKDGYKDPAGLPTTTFPNPSGPGWREVVINGDTQFDAELVRR